MSRLELPELFDLCQQWTKGAVIQFKKLFLSLVFTVALCCGLSVSASAADFRYGGMIGPELPDIDATAYPYQFVYRDSDYDRNTLLFCSVKPAVEKPPSGHALAVTFNQSVDLYVYNLVDGVWTDGHSESYSAYGWRCYLGSFETVWTNVELTDSSGNLVFPAQSPIPVFRTTDLTSSLVRRYFSNSYPYYSSSSYDLSYGAGTSSNLIPVVGGSRVTIAGAISGAYYDITYFDLGFINASGVANIVAGEPLIDGDGWTLSGRQKLGTSVLVPEDAVLIWVNLWKGGQTFTLSNASDIFYGIYYDPTTYNPTITATASNVTDTTVDLAINVTGMDPANTYNIRIDGTTADGEELSQVIGTITGEETYSTSATLGPFAPNTTYRATLVLVENGVDVSSDLIEYTTLPLTYDPHISASQFAVTSTTMTSQVTLSGLDPSKQYRPYYRLSLADDDTVISQGYALDIMPVTGIGEYTAYSRINNLTVNTEYRIIWALFEDGTEYVDAFDYFNFTTLDDGSGGGGSGSSDDNSGILLMILNKVSAILDTMNGGQSEGILASINEKLDSLIATLANPAEQAIEQSFQETTQYVADNVFGGESDLKVTTSNIGDVASIASTGKQLFGVSSTVGDFLGLITGGTGFAWFSEETKAGLTSVDSVSVASYSLEDTLSKEETTWSKHEEEYWKFFDKEE